MSNVKISDLPLVVCLSLAFPIVDMEKDATDTKRVWFIFEDTAELQKYIKDYWSGKLLLDPQKLFSELKQIKSRLYTF